MIGGIESPPQDTARGLQQTGPPSIPFAEAKNYDENLVYVNDFEIFRPYLVSNAQQEGLPSLNLK